MKEVTFEVTGMTCDNCVKHVTEAIKGVAGVTDAKVSLDQKSATVAGDFDVAKVVAAVDEEGYTAVARS